MVQPEKVVGAADYIGEDIICRGQWVIQNARMSRLTVFEIFRVGV